MSDIIILYSGESASLDPTQSGFAHGFGIFETIKLSQGRLCFWEAHWARFRGSADELDLHLEHTGEQVLVAIRQLVEAECIADGAVKVSLLKDESGSCCYVYTRPAMVAADSARLHVSTRHPLNEHSQLAGHKTHNYMENMLLLASARQAGDTDVVRVNTAGSLTETTVGNFFFIQGGELYTPSLKTGILSGVIRAAVLRAARTLSIPVIEDVFSPKLLRGAEAAFVTNSSVGIQPVDTIVGDDLHLTLASDENPILLALVEALAVDEANHAIQLSDD